MKTIPVKTTYLQMFHLPEHDLQPPLEGIEVVRVEKPTVRFYRFMHDAVGREWDWNERQAMADEDLIRIIRDDRVEIYVPYVKGSPAGFAELDCRHGNEIEVKYFGIMREFFGKGLGRYFLHWTIAKAWSHNPERLWLHTCDRDHKAALPLYLKAGFEIFDERMADHVVS